VKNFHVCVVTETYPPEINGAARSLKRAVDHLSGHGHRVSLVRPRQPVDSDLSPESSSLLLTAGMPIPMYPDLRFGLIRSRRLIQWWKRNRPDVVHIATEGPLGLGALHAARTLGIPCTSDFRTNFHLYSRHYRAGLLLPLLLAYLRWFHNRCALTLVPTSALRAELSGAGFRNLCVVGRGVDTASFSPAHRSSVLRRQWGARDGDLVVLYVGRLAREKNVGLVLRTFDAVRKQHPDARLVFVGDGPLRSKVQRQAPHAVLTGWQRDHALAQCYASADLFLFPSMTETFGNVVVEALASGLPTVAFRHGGAGEHMRDAFNGFAVPFGDEAAFIRAACALASDASLRSSIATQARATAEALSWERVLEGFERALEAAVLANEVGHAHLARAA